MPTEDPSVTSLVRRAAEGDARAWEELVDRYAGLVWSVTRAYRLGPSDAADVHQVTWLRLVEHLGRLREPQALPGWLATTARRECITVLRRSGRQIPVDIELEAPAGGSGDVEAPPLDARLVADERAEALRAAFATLPPSCQVLLRLLMTDPPPSYKDVSATLDMPIGSIGPTRARCLERLRRHPRLAGITVG